MRGTDKPNGIGVIEAGTECWGRAEELTISLFKGFKKDFKEIIIFGLGPEGQVDFQVEKPGRKNSSFEITECSENKIN